MKEKKQSPEIDNMECPVTQGSTGEKSPAIRGFKIIPFRIIPNENEEDYSDVYEFLIKGSKKDAYQIKIFIDTFNDLGITFFSCTCPHSTFRGGECKHIKKAKEILEEFEIGKS